MRFKSSTKLDPPADRVVLPARGSGGDPTLAGATLRVYNAAGTGELVTVTLPASGWTTVGAITSLKGGYRFRSPDPGAPVQTVLVKRDRIKVSGGGAAWGYTLNEAPQGIVALRLALGTAPAWCAEAGRPPHTPRVDVVDRFSAGRMPPPAACPALP